jgi:hypothetical protein
MSAGAADAIGNNLLVNEASSNEAAAADAIAVAAAAKASPIVISFTAAAAVAAAAATANVTDYTNTAAVEYTNHAAGNDSDMAATAVDYSDAAAVGYFGFAAVDYYDGSAVDSNDLLDISDSAAFHWNELVYIFFKTGSGKSAIPLTVGMLLTGVVITLVPLVGLGSDQVTKSCNAANYVKAYHVDKHQGKDAQKLCFCLDSMTEQ